MLLFLQMSRQLHGHRTYCLPWGAFLMGVASLHALHLTTCWSLLPLMSMDVWHTLQITMGELPETLWYAGGERSSSGDTVTVGPGNGHIK